MMRRNMLGGVFSNSNSQLQSDLIAAILAAAAAIDGAADNDVIAATQRMAALLDSWDCAEAVTEAIYILHVIWRDNHVERQSDHSPQ